MNLILSKIDNRILWLVKILLVLCLATPLLVSASLLFPYTSIKAFSFRILIEISAFFYFYLALKYPAFRPKKTTLLIAVGAFLLVLFLSSLFGVDSYLSFWGNLERMLGFFGLLHFGAFFLMLAGIFKTEKSWVNLLKISVAVSSFVGLLAILQRFFSLGATMPETGRVFGTIGNPAFLASYLIFNIFFAGYLIFLSWAEKRNWKDKQTILWVTSFFIQLGALFLTGTRGGYVGFFAGAILYLILFALFYPAKIFRKYFLAFLAAIIILGGLIFAFRNSSFVQNNPDLNRLASISLKDVTAQNRLILWQKAWKAWRERPVFGWGPENYEVAINKYFDARLLPYEAWYDRAHNFIFDYGVAGGWLGLLSYLALMAIAIFYLKKISRRNFYQVIGTKNRPEEKDKAGTITFRIFILTVFLVGLLLAYLVQNLFVFDTFVSFLMLFFVLALINFYYLAAREQSSEPRTYPAVMNFGKKILLGSFAIIAVFSVYFLNIKVISASIAGNQIFSLESQNYSQVGPLLEKAVEEKTFASDEIVYQAALWYLEGTQDDPQLTENENLYKLITSYLAETIVRSPSQARNYIALAWMNLYFLNNDQQRIDSAIEQGEKIKELSPMKKEAYMILVAAYSLKNEREKAENIILQARQTDEEIGRQIEEYYNNLNQ
ncbi:MAG: hypothetical protein A2Y98_02180 [Candidatus Portnoybacteria bacterium RBG_19FT_COMBO_36_7]|uniref:O-antigen ligase-related domain-containing protein n=1 Tax=Candidatus Portnoybacteria bacterium RBG_19FT_COMBO_36_7 TaxID=1801992 RepID=A0A1G2F7S6_9BACT|nr:MAG: hypothetical protein A2Y98_02180 [Candidatus Portnoybacteria bacterium RBG_19FT_COMBO_36_7]